MPVLVAANVRVLGSATPASVWDSSRKRLSLLSATYVRDRGGMAHPCHQGIGLRSRAVGPEATLWSVGRRLIGFGCRESEPERGRHDLDAAARTELALDVGHMDGGRLGTDE